MSRHFDQLYPGRFMKAHEFKGRDVTLTLIYIDIEELEGDGGKKVKAVARFKETKKELVVNKTNGLCLKAMFGDDPDNWINKRITFYPAEIKFEDSDLAIRVRGSPDLPADLTFALKLPRKKARDVTLRKTGAKARPVAPAPASAPTQNSPAAPQATRFPQEPPPDVMLPGQAGYLSAEEPPPPGDADAPPAGGGQ